MHQQRKNITLLSGVIITITISGLLLVFVCVSGYVLPEGNRVGEAIRDTLPLPLVIISPRNIITTQEIAEDVDAVRHFYQVQDLSKYGVRIDFSTDEGMKRLRVREKGVLNKALEDRIVMLLAHERSIVVTQAAARDGVRRKLDESGGTAENIEASLERLYRWTMDDFETKVVMPELYEERLMQAIDQETDSRSRAEGRIKEARAALQNGVPFDTVVQQYSEGRTKDTGGSLGWFALEHLSKSLQNPVAKQKIGVVGEVAESELGFHIIVVEETKQEGETILYRLKQVFTKKKTIVDFLVEKMRASPPIILSREYVWDAENASIEFRSEEMKRFEHEMLENPEEHISSGL